MHLTLSIERVYHRHAMKYPSFWDTLNKPIIGLAPMDGVTDAPCRTMHGLYGRPDVVLTEFTNVEGLWRGSDRIFAIFSIPRQNGPSWPKYSAADLNTFTEQHMSSAN